MEPTLTNMPGLCNIQSDITQIYEEESLNYIQVSNRITLDQARSYLSTIQTAYLSYFGNMLTNVNLTRSPIILGVEFRLMGLDIFSRIYYQVFANTPQPCNAFYYDIKYTYYKVNQKELASAKETSLIFQWLPQVTIESILNVDQKYSLTNSLLNYWSSSIFLKFILTTKKS
jgi:hypothetical protein